jgi:hypothetical protein
MIMNVMKQHRTNSLCPKCFSPFWVIAEDFWNAELK